MKKYVLLVIIPLLSYACTESKEPVDDSSIEQVVETNNEGFEVFVNVIFENTLTDENVSIVTTTREAAVLKNYMVTGSELKEKIKFIEPGMYRIKFGNSDVPLVISGEEEKVVLQVYNKEQILDYKPSVSVENINFKSYLDRFSPGKKFIVKEKIMFLSSISPSYVGSQIYTFEIANNKGVYTDHLTSIKNEYKDKSYAENLIKSIEYIQADPVAIGAKVPNFSLPSLKGGNLGPEDFKGKYLLIDFWASWCGPCRHEVPNVKKAYDKYKNKGFEVLAISTDQTDKPWKLAVNKMKMDWSQVRDVRGEVSNIFKIQYIPTVYLVDPQGIIVADNVRGQKLENLLEEIYGF